MPKGKKFAKIRVGFEPIFLVKYYSMSLKKYLIFMSFLTLFCWLAWLVVLFYLNPFEAGFIGYLCFYFSLFFAFLGTFSLFGFFIRVWFSKEPVIFRHLGVSFRQSLWFAILLTTALILQGSRFLRWWNILLLVFFLTFLEFFFLSKKQTAR